MVQMNFFKKQLLRHRLCSIFVDIRNNAFLLSGPTVSNISTLCPNFEFSISVANWYIYIPDFTNLVYFLDRLVGEIMVWYMSLNLVYFYAFW